MTRKDSLRNSYRGAIRRAVQMRFAQMRGESQREPTPDEIREYRLDAADPYNARLNWREWEAHRRPPQRPGGR